MLAINLPQVLEEISAVFQCYETALNQNNVEVLIQKFWQSPEAVRFGATENLYGYDAIVQFRQHRIPPPARRLLQTTITTLGHDVAVISTTYLNAKGDHGRQMQTWLRTDAGWRIVAAHISLLPPQNEA